MYAKRVTVWCVFWSKGIIGLFFLRKSARSGRYSQWRSLSGYIERIFVHKKLKRRILATFCFNRTTLHATQPRLHSKFCVLFLKIALSGAELIPFGNLELLFDTIKDKCYANKPETINALKDNIREAIGEAQLHTIDNMLKNCNNGVGRSYTECFAPCFWRSHYQPQSWYRLATSEL